MILRVVLLALLVALPGCTKLTKSSSKEGVDTPLPASAAESLTQAQQLARRDGRWADALAMLKEAKTAYPESAEIAKLYDDLASERDVIARQIRDQIMVSDAENFKSKIDLLDQLALVDADSLFATSRRLYWKEKLGDQEESLTACGEEHAKTQPVLARRCYALAVEIAGTPELKDRLAAVNATLRASENNAAKRRIAVEKQDRQARGKELLESARAAIEAREYRKALDILDKVAQLQPNNREVSGLQEKAWSMISPQVEALVKLGDHLYLDEQLNAAVATWQAALSLKPDDEDILARIERAKNVLSRLDELRKQQNSPKP
ncbi:tetratricopeptide repeat protein [Thiosocius teredinicola]|uniref:hypothetical protein n=1 Tax=Thiosocius teredinicola TaxID=1973002 RepID=UPI000990D7E7